MPIPFPRQPRSCTAYNDDRPDAQLSVDWPLGEPGQPLSRIILGEPPCVSRERKSAVRLCVPEIGRAVLLKISKVRVSRPKI